MKPAHRRIPRGKPEESTFQEQLIGSSMSTTSKERVLAAMAHRETDRVPIIIGTSNATGIKMHAYRLLKQQLKIQAPGGGFMLASVHTIMSEVPPENILAMMDAAAGY
jgi:uroporphyrinogen-III decarboxylase